MNILFIIDHLEKLKPETDTTLALIAEGQKRNNDVWIAYLEDLRIEHGKPYGKLRIFDSTKGASHKIKDILLEKMNVIFMRKDPPWNIDYIIATQILSLIDLTKTFIINSPHALRNFNEKLGIFQFKKYIPDTLISKNYHDLLHFLKGLECVVAKPLEGYGGHEVIVLHKNDKNKKAVLEMLTHGEKRYIMMQQYLDEVKKGDFRVLILNGKILGVQKRLAAKDDHRSNISAGGSSHKGTLSAYQRKMCERVGQKLRGQGIYFAGIDVIGNFITEINITSPTGLVQISRQEEINLANKVIQFLERMS